MESWPKPRAHIPGCGLVVLSAALLFSAGAAKATPTTRAVAWASCGGACDVPNDLTSVKAIAAGSQYSVALKNDGLVVAWGCAFNYGQCTVPVGLSGVTAIAAEPFFAPAL